MYRYAQRPPFVYLNNAVSAWAIELLTEELSKDTTCDCVVETTHGIPCYCSLHSKEAADEELKPYHLHKFWRSLSYTTPAEHDVWAEHDVADRNILDGMVKTICSRGGPSVRALSRLVRSAFQPESEGLKEPKVADAPKGRPRARKTDRRNPSWHEHASAQCTPPKSRGSSTRSTPNSKATPSSRATTSKTGMLTC